MDEADFNSHCCSLQDTNGGAPTAGKIKAGREEQPVPTGQKEFGHAPLGAQRGAAEILVAENPVLHSAKRWNIEQGPFPLPRTCSWGHPPKPQEGWGHLGIQKKQLKRKKLNES